MSTVGKELCDCGKVAVWLYMPGFKEGSPFFCEECVNRGCSCNHRYVSADAYYPPLETPDTPEGVEGKDWKWLEPGKVWCHIDEEGREYPCCEYSYTEEGWEKEEHEE